MYQLIDKEEEQKKLDKIAGKITPEMLGLKPTNDFAQYAMQTIIDDNPNRAKEYAEKGAIGVMEAGKRYAEDFRGFYDNVISKEEQNAQFRDKHKIIGQNRSNTVDERIKNNEQKKEERNKRINNGTASILDKIGAGFDKWGENAYQAQVDNSKQQKDLQIRNKNNSSFKYTPVSMDKGGRVLYSETDLRRKIGFAEAVSNSIGRGEAVPFISGWIEGNAIKKYREITERIRNGEAIRQDELDYVNRYNDRLNEEYIRGYTIGGQIGDAVVPSLMAFGSELMLGGAVLKGIGLAGKGTAAGVMLGKKLLRTKKVSKSLAKAIAFTTGTTAEAGINAAVTEAVNPFRIFATYQERRLNDETKITDRGTVIFQEAEETPAKAFVKSLGQVYISYFTEGLGALTGGALRGIKSTGAVQFEKVMKANPELEEFIKKSSSVFTKAYEKLNKLPIKGKSAEWLKSQVKFDGFIEELSEEVLEDVLNLTIGTDNEERSLENYAKAVFKSPEEWAVLCGVIALQGAALSIAGNSLGNAMQIKGASFEDIAKVSLNSTEKEKIELLDELIKTGNINIDENALYKNETDINPDTEVLAKLKNKYYTQNRNAEQTEEEALQNADLIARMILNTANKFGMSVEDVDKVFGINIQSMSTEEAKEQLKEPVVYNQSVNKKDKYFANGNKPINNFLEIHKNHIENEPEKYTGKRNFKDVLNHLGAKNKTSVKVQSPIEQVTFNHNNISHLVNENNKERLEDLNKVAATIERPNLIIQSVEDGTVFNYYIKAFKKESKNIGHLQIIKCKEDGSFYVTNYRLQNKKFTDILKTGQVIYDLSRPNSIRINDAPVNNIITGNGGKFNPDNKTYYQSADTAGANINEIEQARKEWILKGVESKFFKKWFGNSKVVDEKGNPKLLTDDRDIYILDGYSNNGISKYTYKMSHRAPFAEDINADIDDRFDYSLEEVAKGKHNQPDDYFSSNGARWYGYNDTPGMESYTAIDNVIRGIKAGRKNLTVTAYRAIPNDVNVKELKNGDWITFSKSYAKTHGEHALEGDYKIIEQEVPVNEVWWDGNDIREWGYDNGKENTPDLYLSIQNPAYLDELPKDWKEARKLRDEGYDGVITPDNKYLVFEKPQIKSVNNQGTFDKSNPNIYLQSAAMKRSEFDNIADFCKDIINNPKINNDKRQFNAQTKDGLNIRVPRDTVVHEQKKHKLTPNEWQTLLDNIDNVSQAAISRQTSRYNGKPVLLKVKVGDNTYGVVLETFPKNNPLISTAFIDSEKNIDNWLKNETIPSGTKTSFLDTRLNDIITDIQPNYKPFNVNNIKNPQIRFQKDDDAIGLSSFRKNGQAESRNEDSPFDANTKDTRYTKEEKGPEKREQREQRKEKSDKDFDVDDIYDVNDIAEKVKKPNDGFIKYVEKNLTPVTTRLDEISPVLKFRFALSSKILLSQV